MLLFLDRYFGGLGTDLRASPPHMFNYSVAPGGSSHGYTILIPKYQLCCASRVSCRNGTAIKKNYPQEAGKCNSYIKSKHISVGGLRQ